jgi:hypothetical protein
MERISRQLIPPGGLANKPVAKTVARHVIFRTFFMFLLGYFDGAGFIITWRVPRYNAPAKNVSSASMDQWLAEIR